MNKSTPISQLPTATSMSNTFMNDQQKQMAAQVNTMAMPQSTQVTDMSTDDDATIQEVLNQVQNITQPQQPSMQMAMPSMQPSAMQMPMQMQQIQQMQQMEQMMPQPPYGMDPSMYMNPHGAQMPPLAAPSMANNYMGNLETFITTFADDIKIAGIIFMVIVTIHFVPINKFIGKYIALDKIPYHDILVKALIAAVLAIVIKKIVVK